MPEHNDITPLLESIGYILDNNINRAVETLKKQILHGENRPVNYIILGKLYRKQGDPIRAIKLHESINSVENLDKKIRDYNTIELIYSYYEYGDFEKAIYYSHNIKNKDIELYKVLADAYLHIKSFPMAIKLFKRLEKQQPVYTRNIAYCYFHKADEIPQSSTKYLRNIKKGLEYYNRSRKGNMLLIDYYYKNKHHKDCIKAIEHFILEKLAKSDTDLHELEKIYFDIDNIENFATTVLKSYKNEEKNIFFTLYLADYYVRKNMNDKAIDILSKNITLNGYKRLIVRKFLFLKNDNLLKTIIDENNYKCLKCDSIFSDYSDICSKCKSIETLKPY